MPRVSTRKSSDCFLVWDLSYEAKRTSHKRGGQRSTRKPSVQLRWQQGKIPFYFKWRNYSEAAQTKRRSSQSMVGKWTDFGSQNQPFYRLIFSFIILDWSCDQSRDIVTNVNVEFPQSVVIWLVLPNKAFLWFFFMLITRIIGFLLCTFPWHHCSGSFSAQFASFPCLSFFAFLNQILFDLVCVQLIFWFPSTLSEVFFIVLYKRGILFVTFFVLDWLQFFCCLWPGLRLSLSV